MEKIKGNEGSNIPLPALSGAEARAVRKFAELEAGRVLVEQAARKAEKEREQLEEERLEKKEKEDGYTRRDTPELSKQSRWFGVEGKLLEEEQLKWVLEMEQELWDALQNWRPMPYGELAKQLEELSRLYRALLEALLTCTTGEEQAIQKDRLDGVLAEKLQLLVEVKLENLVGLLEQMDQTETLKQVWYSLYKQTTGEDISSQRLWQLMTRGKKDTPGGSSGMLFQTRSSGAKITETSQGGRAGGMLSMEEGSVYKPSGRNGIRISQEFVSYKGNTLWENGDGKGTNRTILPGIGQGVFTGKELELAEAFAKHLRESSSLFGSREGACSGEAAGLLAALLSIKGQIYTSDTGRSGAMALPMESLVNRMVDYYLSRKEAYQVCYYTTDLYEKTKDPDRTLNKGLEYAYRLFLEKRSEEDQREQQPYGKEAGFFPLLFGQMTEEEYKKGLRLLRENWKDFLTSIGEDGKSAQFRAQRYSPWGAIVEAEKKRKAREEKENQLFKKQILFLAGAVLLYLGWRFFFS